MSGGNCKRAGYERGPWYEIQCLQNNIKSKEARGEDATFERGLLKAWVKYPGYGKALDGLPPVPVKVVSKIPGGTLESIKPLPGNFETMENSIDTQDDTAPRGRGRPRKTEGEISRSTAWRREKELQGVLI